MVLVIPCVLKLVLSVFNDGLEDFLHVPIHLGGIFERDFSLLWIKATASLAGFGCAAM